MSTIKDIAKKAGVSISTVSYALNGIQKVHPETRDRILALAKEMNYHPNTQARNLKIGATRRIGVFTNELGGPCLGAIMRGVQETLLEYDFDVLVATVNVSNKDRAYNLLRERWLDAAIMIHSVDIDLALLETVAKICPLVLMDREPSRSVLGIENICTIVIDNFQGAFDITQTLLKLGRKNFLYLGGVHGSYDNQKRFEGFQEALGRHGVAFDESWYYECDFNDAVAYATMTALLKEGKTPDAVVCANDEMAMGAMLAIHENGLKIPRDVSVTGFDDNEFARYGNPPLSTVGYDRVGMGRKAVHVLMEMLNGKCDTHSVVVPTKVAIRSSCGSTK